MLVVRATLRVLTIYTTTLIIASDSRLETLAISLLALGVTTPTKQLLAGTRGH